MKILFFALVWCLLHQQVKKKIGMDSPKQMLNKVQMLTAPNKKYCEIIIELLTQVLQNA